MSHRLINLSNDLQRLRREGFHIEGIEGHLFVNGIRYLDKDGHVHQGCIIDTLNLRGEIVQAPHNHTIYFAGGIPHDAEGRPMNSIINNTNAKEIIQGVTAACYCSSKPMYGDRRYQDYYHKITTYAAMIQGPVAVRNAMDVVPVTSVQLPETQIESVFQYEDTASPRHGIQVLNRVFHQQEVAIVGLGGTGSYVLDLVAKTPVESIHLYDGDVFDNHNAFRAPGAPDKEILEKRQQKVEYLKEIYSRMHRNIVAHPVDIEANNIDELKSFDFVFVCVDGGAFKRNLIDFLVREGRPFVDTGMGIVLPSHGRLTGLLRVTMVTPQNSDQVNRYIHSAASVGDAGVYDTNIQIAELNSLAASLAVIQWKRWLGFYLDLSRPQEIGFLIDSNDLISEGEQSD